jgi:hypothetical protein
MSIELSLSSEKVIKSDEKINGYPAATQDISVNIRNRQDCIDTANYGPMNPALPNDEFWQQKADMFKTSIEEAKTALCSNCAAFIQTSEMRDAMAQGLGGESEAYAIIEAANLGFCEIYDFKCAGSRTCDAWVVNGPITDSNVVDENVEKVAEDLAEEEAALADALVTIASNYGKFNEDETGIWAGYDSPEDNEVKDIGVKCANCVLYEGEGVCKIIAQQVEEEGKCRFAVIPDGLVMPEMDDEYEEEDDMEEKTMSNLISMIRDLFNNKEK